MRSFKQGVAKRKRVFVSQTAVDTDAPVRWQFRDVQAQPNVACLLYSMAIRKDQAQIANSAAQVVAWNPYVYHLLGETYTADARPLVQTHIGQFATTATAVGINNVLHVGSLIEQFDWAMSPNTPLVLTGDRLEFGLTTTFSGLVNSVEFSFEYELVTMDVAQLAGLMKASFG